MCSKWSVFGKIVLYPILCSLCSFVMFDGLLRLRWCRFVTPPLTVAVLPFSYKILQTYTDNFACKLQWYELTYECHSNQNSHWSCGSCMGFEYNLDEVVWKSAEFLQVLIPTRPFWKFQSCSFGVVWGSSCVLIESSDSDLIRMARHFVRPLCNIQKTPARKKESPIQPVKCIMRLHTRLMRPPFDPHSTYLSTMRFSQDYHWNPPFDRTKTI